MNVGINLEPMEKLLFELNEEPIPIIGIVNGKWSYLGDPVSELNENDSTIVFNHIKSISRKMDEQLTDNLKF